LVRALTRAVESKIDDVTVRSDSELLVKQMTGAYKVKNEGLRELFLEAKDLAKQIPRFSIEHVRRGENSEADKLCNEALDGARPAANKDSKSKSSPSAERLDKAAVEYLKSIAESWEMGKPYLPTPREVWKRLREMMDEDDIE
jgi:ribonuclease HI